MKTYQDRQQQTGRERVGAMIDGRIAALFRRLPMLAGFAIDAYLQPTEVSICTWPGYVAGEELFGEILETLADLVDERADAAELLCGRTFARTVQ
jgi:hypothetical protein